MQFSEDQFESVLNLPVADVAWGLGQTKARIPQGAIAGPTSTVGRAMEHPVLDDSAIRVEVVCIAGHAEHRMVEEVEELKTELKLGFLAEHLGAMERQRPVLEDREVNVLNPGAAASAGPGIGITSGLESFPCEGLLV